MVIEFISVALAIFLVSVVLERLIIPILASHKIGQKILEIGPRWHKDKAGTPTMGGICFIMAILGVMAVVAITSAMTGGSKDLIPLALALGLATGCIGSVVNMLAVMIDIPVLKYIVFIAVFIVGHSLNMAINVLGAYVHTNRLQFVELFGKFYEGGGRAFSPFSLNTKYFKLKEENKND